MQNLPHHSLLLLDGLQQITVHSRIEHDRGAGLFGRHLIPARRAVLLKELAELAHYWPDMVAGRNHFHTPTMVAAGLWDYLDHACAQHQEPHDVELHLELSRIANALFNSPHAGRP